MECEHENTELVDVTNGGKDAHVVVCTDCDQEIEPEEIDYFKDER